MRMPLPHQPVPLDHDLKHVVAIFRDPIQRLASTYAYIRDAIDDDPESAPKILIGWGANKTAALEIVKRMKKGGTAANDEWLGKSFLGCQTNMVLGQVCFAGTPTDSEADVEQATNRIDNFMFTGLQEEWGLSICLFNYLATGKRFVDPIELIDSRPTQHKGKSSSYDTTNYPQDQADEKLYAHVVAKFKSETAKYQITKQTCSFDPKGRPLEFSASEMLR
jgi:hypothetical protein